MSSADLIRNGAPVLNCDTEGTHCRRSVPVSFDLGDVVLRKIRCLRDGSDNCLHYLICKHSHPRRSTFSIFTAG